MVERAVVQGDMAYSQGDAARAEQETIGSLEEDRTVARAAFGEIRQTARKHVVVGVLPCPSEPLRKGQLGGVYYELAQGKSNHGVYPQAGRTACGWHGQGSEPR